MPFYEYVCAKCGQHHEELQKISDKPLRKCPACGRPALKRQVSAPVFRLKGGGWYETDFKGDKDQQRNLAGEKDPPAEAKPEAKTDAKADAKVEAKVEAKDAPATKEAKPAKAGTQPKSKPKSRPKAKPAARKRK